MDHTGVITTTVRGIWQAPPRQRASTTAKNRDYAQVVLESNGATSTSYSYGDQLISATTNLTGTSYVLKDAQGSTKALTNTNGATTDTYSYNAYGETTSRTGTTANNYLYAGEQYDLDLNQYYNRARYYNQSIGRFSQQDSYLGNNQEPISLHKYLYTNGNPVTYTDPSGYFSGNIADFEVGATVDLNIASAMSVNINIGRTIVSELLRPLMTAGTAVSGTAVAGLIYTTAVDECEKGDDCQIPMPIIFYGAPHGEASQHISDAQSGGITSVLHRSVIGGSRGLEGNWYRSSPECVGNRTSDTGKSCDEYPFNTSIEGGSWNYGQGKVSLRLIKHSDNMNGGIFLNNMYRDDGTNTTEPYLVLAMSSASKSFYITRKGKMIVND